MAPIRCFKSCDFICYVWFHWMPMDNVLNKTAMLFVTSNFTSAQRCAVALAGKSGLHIALLHRSVVGHLGWDTAGPVSGLAGWAAGTRRPSCREHWPSTRKRWAEQARNRNKHTNNTSGTMLQKKCTKRNNLCRTPWLIGPCPDQSPQRLCAPILTEISA